jgi:hypothetical protein
MSKDDDRIARLEAEVKALRRSLDMLQAYVDTETRARMGLTVDDIRAVWHGPPKVQEYGSL